jgi:hypothetical protein
MVVERRLLSVTKAALLPELGFFWRILMSVSGRSWLRLRPICISGREVSCGTSILRCWLMVFISVLLLVLLILPAAHGTLLRRILAWNWALSWGAMLVFWHVLLVAGQVKLKFCKGRLWCLVCLVSVSLTLALMRLLPSLLRWLIRLLGIRRLRKSLGLDWLEMVFELLAGRSCDSVKPRQICFTRFFRSIVPHKSLFVRILLLIHLVIGILTLNKWTILYSWLSRFV